MDASLPLLVVGPGPAGLRLRVLRPIPPGPLLAWCRGIEVGRLELATTTDLGEALDLPVRRLPCVPLPAELRFARLPEGPELAAPWRIESPAMATALLGPATPSLEDLRLEHGLLRGTGIERVNGLLQPALHATINGDILRAVQVETPVPLAEGGCAFRFALPLEPADLTGNGLGVTLHAAGNPAVLARFAWGPALPDAARLAELEMRLLRLEQAGDAARLAGQAVLDRQLRRQQDRIDAFIEAAASLLLDRLAGDEPPAAALRRLIATTAPPKDEVEAVVEGDHATLTSRDAAFDLGWHGPEEDAGGGFRWMTMEGLLRNPAPLRPVAAVTLEVVHLYGAPAPVLEARFDAAPCLVALERRGPHHFSVRITPPGGPVPCRMLRLRALAGGCPAEDRVSGDDRSLSVAIASAGFDYGT